MRLLKSIFIFLLASGIIPASAQITWPSPEVEQLYNQARQYLSNGAFRQAIASYQQVIALAPGQMVLYRDLANAYYLSGNYEKADETLKPILESGQADEQCYQVAAASLDAQREDKKARKMLEKGISKFPHSGLLYHEYGKLYDNKNETPAALKQWIAGISADPGYHVNYYEAARTYMLSDKTIWAILYGEVFVNLEYKTPRANETRKMLLAAYKRLYTTPAADVQAFGKEGTTKAPRNFEEAVQQTFLKLAPVVSDGISTENLVMLRTRFLMEWMGTYGSRYPFTLFTYQDDLLRNGYFDAYNQWLFGRAENQQQFDAWVKFHPEAMPAFEKWQQEHKLKPTAGDHYNDGRVKDIFPENPYKR